MVLWILTYAHAIIFFTMIKGVTNYLEYLFQGIDELCN